MKNSIPASQRHFLAAGKHLKIWNLVLQ
jgi:hypothetical protein